MSNEIVQKSKESFHGSPAHIIDMNEVIAAFDGRKKRTFDDQEWWSDVGDYDPYVWKTGELRYHSDWGWLMPVADKCQNLHRNLPDKLKICGYYYLDLILKSLETFDLTIIHFRIYDYITWRNENRC